MEEGAGNPRRIQDVVRSCREKIRKEKVQLEFNLVDHWCERSLKNVFIIHQQQRRDKENLHAILNTEGDPVSKDKVKAEVLNAFFASSFNSKTSYSSGNQAPDKGRIDREQDSPPVIQEKVVSNLLSNLDIRRSVGPDRIHSRVQRELVEKPCQDTLHHLLSVLVNWGGPRSLQVGQCDAYLQEGLERS